MGDGNARRMRVIHREGLSYRIHHDGHRRTVAQWGPIVGIDPHLIVRRLKRGWAPERALTEMPGTRPSRTPNTYVVPEDHVDVIEFRASLDEVLRAFDLWKRTRQQS